MAIYRLDGWDYMPNTNSGGSSSLLQAHAVADGWYDSISLLGSITGRFGHGIAMGMAGSVFRFGVSEAIGKRWTTETCVIGQAVYYPSGGSPWYYSINDAQGAAGVQIALEWDDNGILRLYRGTSGTPVLIAGTPAKTYHGDQWDYIEIKFKIHPTAGTVEVRVNTVVVLSYSGPTANRDLVPVLSLANGWDCISLNGGTVTQSGATPAVYFDDRYILDNTGAVNTDYLGNVRVNSQLMTANGDTDNFAVTGASANWQAVLGDHIDDTKYVADGTVNDIDLYVPNPNVVSTNIFAAQIRHVARQDDATQKASTGLMKVSGTLYAGSNHYLSGNYTHYRDVWELNPVTGVGWTAAQLNGLQAGIKVIQ